MLDELGLDEDVLYFINRSSVRDFLLILLRLIGENRILYQKIYHANQDGDLMRIIRTGLIHIMNDKVQAAEQKGYRLKLPAPIFASLMTDFYFNIVQCYLDQEEPCDPDSFVDSVCLFIERDFLRRRRPDAPAFFCASVSLLRWFQSVLSQRSRAHPYA